MISDNVMININIFMTDMLLYTRQHRDREICHNWPDNFKGTFIVTLSGGCSRLARNDDVVYENLLKFYVIVYDAHWWLNE